MYYLAYCAPHAQTAPSPQALLPPPPPPPPPRTVTSGGAPGEEGGGLAAASSAHRHRRGRETAKTLAPLCIHHKTDLPPAERRAPSGEAALALAVLLDRRRGLVVRRPCGLCGVLFPPCGLRHSVSARAIGDARRRWEAAKGDAPKAPKHATREEEAAALDALLREKGPTSAQRYDERRVCRFCAQMLIGVTVVDGEYQGNGGIRDYSVSEECPSNDGGERLDTVDEVRIDISSLELVVDPAALIPIARAPDPSTSTAVVPRRVERRIAPPATIRRGASRVTGEMMAAHRRLAESLRQAAPPPPEAYLSKRQLRIMESKKKSDDALQYVKEETGTLGCASTAISPPIDISTSPQTPCNLKPSTGDVEMNLENGNNATPPHRKSSPLQLSLHTPRTVSARGIRRTVGYSGGEMHLGPSVAEGMATAICQMSAMVPTTQILHVIVLTTSRGRGAGPWMPHALSNLAKLYRQWIVDTMAPSRVVDGEFSNEYDAAEAIREAACDAADARAATFLVVIVGHPPSCETRRGDADDGDWSAGGLLRGISPSPPTPTIVVADVGATVVHTPSSDVSHSPLVVLSPMRRFGEDEIVDSAKRTLFGDVLSAFASAVDATWVGGGGRLADVWAALTPMPTIDAARFTTAVTLSPHANSFAEAWRKSHDERERATDEREGFGIARATTLPSPHQNVPEAWASRCPRLGWTLLRASPRWKGYSAVVLHRWGGSNRPFTGAGGEKREGMGRIANDGAKPLCTSTSVALVLSSSHAPPVLSSPGAVASVAAAVGGWAGTDPAAVRVVWTIDARVAATVDVASDADVAGLRRKFLHRGKPTDAKKTMIGEFVVVLAGVLGVYNWVSVAGACGALASGRAVVVDLVPFADATAPWVT